MSTVQVSQEKLETVDNILNLLDKYDIIAAADLYKVGSEMLHDLRRQLREQMKIRCIKNTLMRISLEKTGKKNAEQFMKLATGSNVFLFTNGNPFKIAMELEANKVKVFAKAGDIALNDLIIAAGNTGLTPGPLIGKFGVLGIRTRIEAGNIWVTQDTIVAKLGDVISEDLADLLQRMGIKASEMDLRIKAVFEKDEIIPGDQLYLDLDEYRKKLETAIGSAFNVAIQTSYATKKTLPLIISKVAQDAIIVAIEINYLTKKTVNILIAKASYQARRLASKVGEVQARNR